MRRLAGVPRGDEFAGRVEGDVDQRAVPTGELDRNACLLLDVPDSHRPALAQHGEAAAVRGDGEIADGPLVSVEVAWLGLRLVEVEDADRAGVVVVARGEAAAVGEEGQGVGPALRSRENERLRAEMIEVPDVDLSVVTSEGQAARGALR